MRFRLGSVPLLFSSPTEFNPRDSSRSKDARHKEKCLMSAPRWIWRKHGSAGSCSFRPTAVTQHDCLQSTVSGKSECFLYSCERQICTTDRKAVCSSWDMCSLANPPYIHFAADQGADAALDISSSWSSDAPGIFESPKRCRKTGQESSPEGDWPRRRRSRAWSPSRHPGCCSRRCHCCKDELHRRRHGWRSRRVRPEPG